MDELTLDNKKYLSSKKAAQITGYAKDYVGQLCREGRVTARLVGRNWYVLESAILEHRFGPAEAEESAPVSDRELETTWQTPTYMAESQQMVPELTPKPYVAPQEPVSSVSNASVEAFPREQVVSDMQAAWKEWFDSQKNEEELLPDASPMLLADHEEGVQEPQIELQRPTEEEAESIDEVPVHIERHSYAEQPRYERPRIEDMPISRRYQEIEREEYVAPTVTRVDYGIQRPGAFGTKGRKRSRLNTSVLRALFLSLAGLAIAAAVVGSGALDGVAAGKSGTFVTDFLSGTKAVSK